MPQALCPSVAPEIALKSGIGRDGNPYTFLLQVKSQGGMKVALYRYVDCGCLSLLLYCLFFHFLFFASTLLHYYTLLACFGECYTTRIMGKVGLRDFKRCCVKDGIHMIGHIGTCIGFNDGYNATIYLLSQLKLEGFSLHITFDMLVEMISDMLSLSLFLSR